ncbi:MAG: aldehyde dehydrogenase family protein [Candidatus Aminicenantes bacterium]|jgi:succinate-semialdehyde dehydrogenase/glutarate-semialdehyde dehydrogenase
MDGTLLINNNRITTEQKIASINPATLESLGETCLATEKECLEAVDAAKNAFISWKETQGDKKRQIFKNAKKILLQKSTSIAMLITKEHGSPLPESLSMEVLSVAEALDYYAHSTDKNLSPQKMRSRVALFLHKSSAFHFAPLGPTLVISPWNFPFMLPILDVISAISSGNTVILKPSTSTPLVASKIGDIFVEAGLPAGVLNIVNCKVPQAEKLIAHPDIQNILFTGSVTTGKRVMELASTNLTNIVLELGGKDPMVVLKDADMERAVLGAVWAGFANCGQSCGAIERVYVDRDIAEEFTDRVVKHTRKLRVGDPMEPEIDIGPMTTKSQLAVVRDHITDAQTRGAQVLCGGTPLESLPGYFINPAVLTGVDHSMKIMTEETFGPALPIMTFADPEEAISLANDCSLGLTASIWTRNKKMAHWMAGQLEAGTVTVNDHMSSFAEPGAIWGGVKSSGIGRSHGHFGQLDLMNIKFISHDYTKKKTLAWWFPYNAEMTSLMDKTLRYFHGEHIGTKLKALFALVPHLSRILSSLPLSNLIRSLPKLIKK